MPAGSSEWRLCRKRPGLFLPDSRLVGFSRHLKIFPSSLFYRPAFGQRVSGGRVEKKECPSDEAEVRLYT
jgi:hypothetical protein